MATKPTIALKTVLKHVTSDGSEFTDKGAAQAHEISLLRVKALKARVKDLKLTRFQSGDNLSGELTDTWKYLSVMPERESFGAIESDYDDVFAFIADNADLLLEVLTVKKPGGRKPKPPAPVRKPRAARPAKASEEPFAAH